MQNIEYLDPEIANEGERVSHNWSPGDPDWQPMQARPVIPTYEGVKSILKYFPALSGRPYIHKAFPAWFYHQTEAPRYARDADAAAKLGIVWRKCTTAERAQGFPAERWECSGDWAVMPFDTKFDPKNPGTGKSYVPVAASAADSQASIIAAVVAAVGQLLKQPGQPVAQQIATDPDFNEFLEFKAWKAAQKPSGGDQVAPGEPLSDDDQKEILTKAAAEKGVKIDGRWSLARIKEELDKITP